MSRFAGTEVVFGADKDKFTLDVDARELPLIHADNHLNDLLLKYCEMTLANRRGDVSPFRTKWRTRLRRCFLMEEFSWEKLLELWA